MKNKWFIFLFCILILINLAVRLPIINIEAGGDSAYIHQMSQSIIDNGEAKWIIHPASVAGLFPYSYPSSVQYIIAILTSITNIDMTHIILIISFIFGIVCMLGSYILALELTKNNVIGLFAAIAYSLNSRIVGLTVWGISTRGLFFALFPIFLYTLVKFINLKDKKYLFLATILLLIQIITHRMGLLIFFTVVPAFLIMYVLITFKKQFKFFREKIKIFLLIGTLIFILFIFLPFYPLKSNFASLTHGLFFNGNNFVVMFLNLIVDYISYVNPVLMIFGFLGIVFYFIKNKLDDGFKFIYLTLVISIPLIINSLYMAFFLIIFISLFFGIFLSYFTEIEIKQSYKIATISLVILLIVGYLLFRFSFPTSKAFTVREFDTGIKYYSGFIDNLDGNIISDTNANAVRIMSITDKYTFPFIGAEWYISGYIDKNEEFTFNPELQFKTDYLWKGKNYNSKYSSFIKQSSIETPIALKELNDMNINYIYLRRNQNYRSEAPVFHRTNEKNKIFNSQVGEIWII